MEKHAAYCAMMRLGLKVPETVLVPYKNPLDNSRYAYTAARYNKSFDLDTIAEKIGYPIFMKPYDGGAWRGVSRINTPAELHAAYDASGEMLMHLPCRRPSTTTCSPARCRSAPRPWSCASSPTSPCTRATRSTTASCPRRSAPRW